MIVITLMKKTFLESGSERTFFVGPIDLSMIINETFPCRRFYITQECCIDNVLPLSEERRKLADKT